MSENTENVETTSSLFDECAHSRRLVLATTSGLSSSSLVVDSLDASLEMLLNTEAAKLGGDGSAGSAQAPPVVDAIDRMQLALARIDAGEIIPDDEKAALTEEWTDKIRPPSVGLQISPKTKYVARLHARHETMLHGISPLKLKLSQMRRPKALKK